MGYLFNISHGTKFALLELKEDSHKIKRYKDYSGFVDVNDCIMWDAVNLFV